MKEKGTKGKGTTRKEKTSLLLKVVKYVLIVLFIIPAVIFITGLYNYNLGTISGNSMYPTLVDGQIVFFETIYSIEELEDQDIITAYIEYKGVEHYICKRYYEEYSTDDGVWLLGDNTGNSVDSETFGLVDNEAISTKVYPAKECISISFSVKIFNDGVDNIKDVLNFIFHST